MLVRGPRHVKSVMGLAEQTIRIKGYVGRLADRRQFRTSHDLRSEGQELERVLVRFSKPSTNTRTFSCSRLGNENLESGHEEYSSRTGRWLTGT